MPNARQWEYASLVQAERHRDGLDKAEGLPRESTPVTPGRRHPNPDDPDGKWLTEHVVAIDELTGPPPEYAVQRSRRVQAHEGKTVTLPSGQYTIPTNATAVDRAARWDDSTPRGVARRP